MNIYSQMKQKKGCPKCQLDQGSFTWSGAAIEIPEFITGGYGVIAHRPAFPDEASTWPEEDVVRCHVCKAIWDINWRWPDRPPLYLRATYIKPEEYESFFKGLCDRLIETYGQKL